MVRYIVYAKKKSQCPVLKGTASQWDESGTGDLPGEGGGGKNGAPYILILTSILSPMEHVKTLNGRYLLEEPFFQTFLLKNKYFKVINRT